MVDNIKLEEEGMTNDFTFSDSKKINWSNRLYSLNWSQDLSDKIFFHTQLGASDYYFDSSSYNESFNTSTAFRDSLTVQSTSWRE